MRLAVALLLLLAACGGVPPLEQRVLGSWRSAPEGLLALEEYRTADVALRKEYRRVTEEEAMEFVITADRITGSSRRRTVRNFRYTVAGRKGDRLLLDATDEEGHEERITLWFWKEFLVGEIDGMRMVMRRG